MSQLDSDPDDNEYIDQMPDQGPTPTPEDEHTQTCVKCDKEPLVCRGCSYTSTWCWCHIEEYGNYKHDGVTIWCPKCGNEALADFSACAYDDYY